MKRCLIRDGDKQNAKGLRAGRISTCVCKSGFLESTAVKPFGKPLLELLLKLTHQGTSVC